jgi:hypothetical protein
VAETKDPFLVYLQSELKSAIELRDYGSANGQVETSIYGRTEQKTINRIIDNYLRIRDEEKS